MRKFLKGLSKLKTNTKPFWGKINKMHFTKNTVMVVYSQEVYKDFMKVLPENLQKLLEKGTSVVRNRT